MKYAIPALLIVVAVLLSAQPAVAPQSPDVQWHMAMSADGSQVYMYNSRTGVTYQRFQPCSEMEQIPCFLAIPFKDQNAMLYSTPAPFYAPVGVPE